MSNVNGLLSSGLANPNGTTIELDVLLDKVRLESIDWRIDSSQFTGVVYCLT